MTVPHLQPDQLDKAVRDLVELTPDQCEAASLLVWGLTHIDVAEQLDITLRLLYAWEEHHYGFRALYLFLDALAERQARNQQRELVLQQAAAQTYLLDNDPEHRVHMLPLPPATGPRRPIPTAIELLESDVLADLETDVRRTAYAEIDDIEPGHMHRPYADALTELVDRHHNALELAKEQPHV